LPSEFPDEARLRLERFAGVLRRFGLVDRDGIGTRVCRADNPKLPTLNRLLAPFGDALPKGLTVEFLSKSVRVALTEPCPATLAWREHFALVHPQLTKIDKGRKHAGRYHKHVFDLLFAIFDGSLANGRIEQEMHTGIQRVDILFDNMGGVFSKIANIIGMASPYIPFECKNYVGDLGNPEYDQLSGRLNPGIGFVGVLIFRSITDWGRANEHCQVKLKDGKYVILLDDSDLDAMYQKRHDGDLMGLDEIILGRLRAIQLNISAK